MSKIGAGHAEAMLRSGFKEIGQIIPAFPASGVQPVEEPGLAGNLTAMEVIDTKHESSPSDYASRSMPAREQEMVME